MRKKNGERKERVMIRSIKFFDNERKMKTNIFAVILEMSKIFCNTLSTTLFSIIILFSFCVRNVK